MRCLIEKVVRFPGAETVRLTGPTEPDLTLPGQAKFVICNHTIEQDHRSVKRITRPELVFKSYAAVQDTLVGIELMCIIEQRQMVVEKGGKVSLQPNSSTPWLLNHLTVRVTSSQITYARKFETKPLRVMARPILGGLH
jgi:hypothetical protein